MMNNEKGKTLKGEEGKVTVKRRILIQQSGISFPNQFISLLNSQQHALVDLLAWQILQNHLRQQGWSTSARLQSTHLSLDWNTETNKYKQALRQTTIDEKSLCNCRQQTTENSQQKGLWKLRNSTVWDKHQFRHFQVQLCWFSSIICFCFSVLVSSTIRRFLNKINEQDDSSLTVGRG